MSRPQERANKSHLAVVAAAKRARPGVMGLKSRLGHAASIGGVEHVKRVGYSDTVLEAVFKLDAAGRREAIEALPRLIERASDKARALPASTGRPQRDQRVKVRWSEVMIARFKVEAMRCADNVELAKRLGLPAYCEGSMRAARSRYFRHATVKAPSRPSGRPRAVPLAMAA